MKLILLFAFVGSISCALKDHASRLYIGAALSPTHLNNDASYKSIAEAQFNCLTPENEMKIDATEPSQGQFSFTSGDELVTFAKENSMKVRGHTLVWHSQVPSWMNSISGSALIDVMENHITNVMTHWKGSIYAWDVVNEAFNEDGSLRESIWHTASSDYIATAFKLAQQTDPNAKLYINDYNIEGINSKSTGLYDYVSQLLERSVPVQGVGFQCHFTVGQIPSTFQQNLQRFADLGLDVAITELDIASNGQGDAAQAAAYGSVVSACAAVSKCVGVTIWGISDDYSWRSGSTPLPWDSSHNPKTAVISAIENALV